MKLEQLRVPLIPRSNIDCFDLGIMFYGRHLKSMLRLWCWVAVPAMLAAYLGARYQTLHLGHVLTGLFLLTGVWSPLLVGKTSHAVFGEPFDRYPANGRERQQLARLMVKATGARLLMLLGFCLMLAGWWIAGIALVLPGCYIGVRSSFFPEKFFLSSMEGRAQDRRTSELIQQELGALTGRVFGTALLMVCVVVCLFATVDFFSDLLFQKPILWGQIVSDEFGAYSLQIDSFDEFFDLLFKDPLILAVLAGVILFAYPIVRFAWFFCYIDLRVRGDFWDLELRFQKEVERLQEASL